MPFPSIAPIERAWRHISRDPATGCWVWTGARQSFGHGVFRDEQRVRQAHIILYEIMVEPVPEGLELDHLCRNPPCVNPAHLEPVSHAVNMARGVFATRAHCGRGHSLDEANTYIYTKPNGLTTRQCRTCHRERQRNRLARIRAREQR